MLSPTEMGTAPSASAQDGGFEPLTHRNATGKITHLGLSMERTFQNMTYMELLIKVIFFCPVTSVVTTIISTKKMDVQNVLITVAVAT
jgi:hypothetical protein